MDFDQYAKRWKYHIVLESPHAICCVGMNQQTTNQLAKFIRNGKTEVTSIHMRTCDIMWRKWVSVLRSDHSMIQKFIIIDSRLLDYEFDKLCSAFKSSIVTHCNVSFNLLTSKSMEIVHKTLLSGTTFLISVNLIGNGIGKIDLQHSADLAARTLQSRKCLFLHWGHYNGIEARPARRRWIRQYFCRTLFHL